MGALEGFPSFSGRDSKRTGRKSKKSGRKSKENGRKSKDFFKKKSALPVCYAILSIALSPPSPKSRKDQV
jgi:hypothetical protein